MIRHGSRTATFLCLLALWLQVLAPVLALSMQNRAVDPFSVICQGSAAAAQDRSSTHHSGQHACDHCLLCQAVAGGLPANGSPAFTRSDYPVVGPQRRHAVASLGSLETPKRKAQPRAPPISI